MKGKIKIVLFSAGIILLILLSAFVVWAEFMVGVSEIAENSLVSDNIITVTDNGYLAFENCESTDYGFIFYAGARVEAEAYAPSASAISRKGINVFLPHFPLDLAILGENKAKIIIAEHPEIDSWFIGGHSMGGVVAGNYYSKNEKLEGMIFLASYPAQNISERSGKVLSIYGSNDGLTTKEDIEASKALLPEHTIFVEIEGGNHGQFGYYGIQKNDLKASISQQEQTGLIVDQITDFILE